MIKEIIANWETVGIAGAVVITFGWGFIHLLRFVTGIIKGELKDLAKYHTAAALEHSRNAVIQERLASSLDKHEDASRERDITTLTILKNTLNLSNGGNPAVKKCMEDINELFRIVKEKK